MASTTPAPVITVTDDCLDVVDDPDDPNSLAVPGCSNSSMQLSQEVHEIIPTRTPANCASAEKDVKRCQRLKKKQSCRALKFSTNENAQAALIKKQNDYFEKALQMEEEILRERLREVQLKKEAAEDEVKLKLQAAEYAAKSTEHEAKVKMQVADFQAKLQMKIAEHEAQLKMQAAEYNLEILKIRKEKELFDLEKAKSAILQVESAPGK